MNEIKIFENEKFGKVRTTLIENEPWFVAADVCKALEIGNPSQAIARLDEDEKENTLISNEGITRGNPNMTVVNEAGLYTLILSSRKPEAKTFKRWITHDVIPSIRKHGIYATEEVLDKMIDSPEFGIKLLTSLKEEREKRKALENVVEVQGNQLEEQKSLVEFANRVSNTDRLISVGEMAKLLKDKGFNVGRNKFFEYLRDNKILMGNNVPYQKYIDAGYFHVRETSNRNGGVFLTTYVTGKGQMYLVDKVKNLSK